MYFVLRDDDMFDSLFFFLALATVAQTRISGKVTDQKGMVIPGANIYIKGTYDGTSSDLNGNFQFTTDEQGKQILVVQSIGYKAKEVDIECAGKWLTE